MADENYRRLVAACHCGIPAIPAVGAKTPKKYCSKRCKLVAWRASNPERKRELDQRHLARAPKSSPVWFKSCRICSAPCPTRSNTSICSLACGRAEHAAESRRFAESRHKRIGAIVRCASCGCEYCPLYGRKPGSAPHCSPCAEAKRRAARKTERKAYGTTHRQRARHYGVEYSPFLLERIFERDGWRCQLCGADTPRELRGSLDPRAPELDHIVPLSRGGPHAFGNSQCACRSCNGAKGADPDWRPGIERARSAPKASSRELGAHPCRAGDRASAG